MNGHRLPLFAAPDVAPCGLRMKEIRLERILPDRLEISARICERAVANRSPAFFIYSFLQV